MIDLSVVVVTWNTRDLTLECLESIAEALECGGDEPSIRTEVVVVDNGSVDGTALAIRERFAWVRLLELPRNLGYAGGNNAALGSLRGRVVLLLNSDARLTRDAVDACLWQLGTQSDVGIAGPQLLHRDGRLQNSIHAFPSLLTELVPTWLLETSLPGRFPSKRRAPPHPVEVEALVGAALFIRREALEDVGALDERYFFYLEETDLCWRMRAAGWRVIYVPAARLVHLSGASSKAANSALSKIEFHRSLYRFLRAHRGAVTLSIARAVRMFRLLIAIPLLSPLALGSQRQRQRLEDRSRLLGWHLRGCPAGVGLAQIGGDPRSDAGGMGEMGDSGGVR